MSKHVDISPYINEINELQKKKRDTDYITFVLKIMTIMKSDRDLFILLHHALPKYVARNSRLAIFLTWGFHANNFSNEIQNLDQNLASMKKDKVIGEGDQATVEEVRDFLVQAQKILSGN